MINYTPFCPTCGGALTVAENSFQTVCSYCGNTVITQEAERQGSPSNDGTPTVFDLINNGYELLRINQYDRAFVLFNDLVETFPKNYRVWWGIVLAGTRNLSTYAGNDRTFRAEAQNAINFAPNNEGFSMETGFNHYIRQLNDSLKEEYQNDDRRYERSSTPMPSWKKNPTKKGFFGR